jgi:hypothetical protein
MTELSPAAKSVLDAIESRIDRGAALAAALRAVANEVAPETPESEPGDPDILIGIWSERRMIRDELLAIADELERL